MSGISPPMLSKISCIVEGPRARCCTTRVLSGMRSVDIDVAAGPLCVRAMGTWEGIGEAWKLDGSTARGANELAATGLPVTRSARCARWRSSATFFCAIFSAARNVAPAVNGTERRPATLPTGSSCPSVCA